MELELRVQRLERTIRRLTFLSVIPLLGLAIVLGSGFRSERIPDVLRAKSFEIVEVHDSDMAEILGPYSVMGKFKYDVSSRTSTLDLSNAKGGSITLQVDNEKCSILGGRAVDLFGLSTGEGKVDIVLMAGGAGGSVRIAADKNSSILSLVDHSGDQRQL